MKIRGTKDANHLKMTYGIDRVLAGKGDDHVFLLNSLDAVVNGGEGDDTFEFRVFQNQDYSITRSGDDTVISITSDGYEQTVTLHDFESIVVREMDF